jgi:transposase-like protein
MPMVPCPECKELKYRQKKPKDGAKRYPCKACVAWLDRRRGENTGTLAVGWLFFRQTA